MEETTCKPSGATAQSALRLKKTVDRYVSPLERDFQEYYSSTKQFNRNLQAAVAAYLCDCIGCDSNSDFALATTGSDGRLEKGIGSKMELVVLAKSLDNTDNIIGLANKCMEDIMQQSIFENIEVKDIEKDTISLYRPTNQMFPTRIMDLSNLCGNAFLMKETRQKLVSELASDFGTKIIDSLAGRRKEYGRIMNTGQQRYKQDNIIHYDIGEGKMYYNPSGGQYSFKYGPLRTIQMALAKDLCALIRNTGYYDLMLDMPNNPEERIYFLENQGCTNLPQGELSDLASSYKFFLWLYHHAQWAHTVKNEEVTDISLYKKEAADRLQRIDSILQKPILSMQ